MSLTPEDLNHIRLIVGELTSDLASKDDLKQFATKDDLKQFATKEDLRQFATKSDMDRMESRIVTSISLLERDVFTRLDQHEARITKLEQGRASA